MRKFPRSFSTAAVSAGSLPSRAMSSDRFNVVSAVSAGPVAIRTLPRRDRIHGTCDRSSELSASFKARSRTPTACRYRPSTAYASLAYTSAWIWPARSPACSEAIAAMDQLSIARSKAPRSKAARPVAMCSWAACCWASAAPGAQKSPATRIRIRNVRTRARAMGRTAMYRACLLTRRLFFSQPTQSSEGIPPDQQGAGPGQP